MKYNLLQPNQQEALVKDLRALSLTSDQLEAILFRLNPIISIGELTGRLWIHPNSFPEFWKQVKNVFDEN